MSHVSSSSSGNCWKTGGIEGGKTQTTWHPGDPGAVSLGCIQPISPEVVGDLPQQPIPTVTGVLELLLSRKPKLNSSHFLFYSRKTFRQPFECHLRALLKDQGKVPVSLTRGL